MGGLRAEAGALAGAFPGVLGGCVLRPSVSLLGLGSGRPCAPSVTPGHSQRDSGPGRPHLASWAWSLGATVTVSRASHARGARCPVPAGCGGMLTLWVSTWSQHPPRTPHNPRPARGSPGPPGRRSPRGSVRAWLLGGRSPGSDFRPARRHQTSWSSPGSSCLPHPGQASFDI